MIRKKIYFRRNKKLTYDEISKMYNISQNKVNAIIIEAYNKIIDYYVEKLNFNIFETVLFLCKFFQITEKEAFNNLNEKNKQRIKDFVLARS